MWSKSLTNLEMAAFQCTGGDLTSLTF